MINSILMPNDIYIEITSKCNMDCVFCPYGVLKRPKQHMNDEYVLKILDELILLKSIGYDIPPVTFHCLGEPLLNSNLNKYMSICDENDIQYWLVTNGLLLNKNKCKDLFSHKNLIKLEFSFHTINERTFSLRGMKNYPFSKYLEQIKEVVFNEDRIKNNALVQIDVMYDKCLEAGKVFNAYDNSELKVFLEKIWNWKLQFESLHPEIKTSNKSFYKKNKLELKGDCFSVVIDNKKIPEKLFFDLEKDINWLSWEVFPKFMISIKRFFWFTPNRSYIERIIGDRGGYSLKLREKATKCDFSNSLVILSNGDITYCCLDYEGSLSCGNIGNMSLEEALKSKKRMNLLTDACSSSYCRECLGKKSIDWKIDFEGVK